MAAIKQSLNSIRPIALPLALLLALFVCLHPRSAQALEGVLHITSNPVAEETVYAGDTLSYMVSIGKDGELLRWTWLRITLNEGVELVTDSVQLNCAATLPASASENASGGMPTPMPISRDVVMGNTGFVLLSSAMLDGDTISFDVVVRENTALEDAPEKDARIVLTAQTEQTSISIAHTLGIREPAAALPTPETPGLGGADTTPAPVESANTPSRTTIWLAYLCAGGLCASAFFVYLVLRPKKKMPLQGGKKKPARITKRKNGAPEKAETETLRSNVAHTKQTIPYADVSYAAMPEVVPINTPELPTERTLSIEELPAPIAYPPAPFVPPTETALPELSVPKMSVPEMSVPEMSVEEVRKMAEKYKRLVEQAHKKLNNK